MKPKHYWLNQALQNSSRLYLASLVECVLAHNRVPQERPQGEYLCAVLKLSEYFSVIAGKNLSWLATHYKVEFTRDAAKDIQQEAVLAAMEKVNRIKPNLDKSLYMHLYFYFRFAIDRAVREHAGFELAKGQMIGWNFKDLLR